MNDTPSSTEGFTVEAIWGGDFLIESGDPGDFLIIMADLEDGAKTAVPFVRSEISELLSNHRVKVIGYGYLLGFSKDFTGARVRKTPIVAWRLNKGESGG